MIFCGLQEEMRNIFHQNPKEKKNKTNSLVKKNQKHPPTKQKHKHTLGK